MSTFFGGITSKFRSLLNKFKKTPQKATVKPPVMFVDDDALNGLLNLPEKVECRPYRAGDVEEAALQYIRNYVNENGVFPSYKMISKDVFDQDGNIARARNCLKRLESVGKVKFRDNKWSLCDIPVGEIIKVKAQTLTVSIQTAIMLYKAETGWWPSLKVLESMKKGSTKQIMKLSKEGILVVADDGLVYPAGLEPQKKAQKVKVVDVKPSTRKKILAPIKITQEQLEDAVMQLSGRKYEDLIPEIRTAFECAALVNLLKVEPFVAANQLNISQTNLNAWVALYASGPTTFKRKVYSSHIPSFLTA